MFVHEMGHLLAGLAVGIKAEAFSIGFGPILLKKQIKGIDFRFSDCNIIIHSFKNRSIFSNSIGI